MVALQKRQRNLRYWFETDRPIKKHSILVLDGVPDKKNGFGPWMVASVRLADRIKMHFDPRCSIKHLEVREKYTESLLNYGDGFVFGEPVNEVKRRLANEIFGGHADLLIKYFHIAQSYSAKKAFIGYLVPDPVIFAPQIVDTLKRGYAGKRASETITFIYDTVCKLIEGHRLVSFHCTILHGSSNSAFSSLEFKCGVCDQKASIVAGIASVLFDTRIVGYGDVTRPDWERVCQLEGMPVTPDLPQFFLDRHYWVEILGESGWIPINTMPNGAYQPKVFELQRRHFGKVCSEYFLNQ
jgi:hypothetical protein